ncbi:hypothetical protein SEA_GIBBLES_60 [Gordonia phage Gibbles]|uniref:Uncharacterized protein n=3 Tax=Gordonia phage Orchid TaxID=1838075 RepID=A0A166YGH3_9CAUD|nr:hypothetical protein BH761_gp061 [Gordonia phage Orchid]ANA87296.1 hypothetical protein PBI_PATRICKSTAR_62 [Gordonia phage PatrickStar]ANA87408.1 hypothetical protein PBI_ORCHID_61 [Gordonia phage Orchid]ANA87523.1 hypothetical protein PBI_KAMPE_62 [Gordonia phage Kampe]QDK02019.1 hypothetical protein SEA_GIBBLES_60 [Gordonia phage Gibbles]
MNIKKLVVPIAAASSVVFAAVGTALVSDDPAPAKPCVMVIEGGTAPCPPFIPMVGGDPAVDPGNAAPEETVTETVKVTETETETVTPEPTEPEVDAPEDE